MTVLEYGIERVSAGFISRPRYRRSKSSCKVGRSAMKGACISTYSSSTQRATHPCKAWIRACGGRRAPCRQGSVKSVSSPGTPISLSPGLAGSGSSLSSLPRVVSFSFLPCHIRPPAQHLCLMSHLNFAPRSVSLNSPRRAESHRSFAYAPGGRSGAP